MSDFSFAARVEPAERGRLETALGHGFADELLLVEALTHRSFTHERGLEAHNERLEFLGDAVLGMVAAEWLFRRHPDRPEGELARAKSALVSAAPLAGYAARLDLGSVVRLGINEVRTGGRERPSVLADVLEALFGAVHLDGGIAASRRVVERYLDWAEGAVEWRLRDAKTELQERLQAAARPLPEYVVVAESGPDHDKLFTCEAQVAGEVLGRGEGRTKKEAQQQAAAAALARFGERPAG
ncbi:MAG: ribonuclease III [Thermoanaerobaculia bacterium]|nr:ribonuclease III [Thermoanaerobaculia bacterium]